ncbi:MAG TPA: glycoside hydrolase family 15 protein [Polyangia bacterium]|nr:glycoside hydrolase family 15 protein [Polyangia bacterium]
MAGRAPARIQDYGLIGDGRSAALVSRGGSIDWLCWPRFDSAPVFAAILDTDVAAGAEAGADKGGRWRIAPTGEHRVRRQYTDDSNVLVTTFDCAGGAASVTDLMTVFSEEDKQHQPVAEHELLRVVEGLTGEVELAFEFSPRPDFGRRLRPLRQTRGLGLRLEDGRHLYSLRSNATLVPPGPDDGDRDGARTDGKSGGGAHSLLARFVVRAGQRLHFSLTYDAEAPAVLPPLGPDADERVRRTVAWWRDWSRRCSYDGPYRPQVVRSVLTLKLLSFAPSGAIVAAPTTSLPERLGGDLNWDYRFCWIRDASLTVRSLFDLGYHDEAQAFVSWLLHTTRLTRPRLNALYDVYGELPKNEEIVSHLDGHRGSRPVRVRNAAAAQLQLDTYGEVIDSVAQMCGPGMTLDRETQEMLRQFGHYVCENWNRADEGIWEPRCLPQHHTHSRLLCWVALDRLLALGEAGVLTRMAPDKDKFETNRRLLRSEIEERAWNPTIASYTQILDGNTVDASLLLLSWYGFTTPDDPRMRSTFARIEERLQAAPGLFYRYEQSLPLGEGAFGICSFWAAEFLAGGGASPEQARRTFEHLLSYANDLGLFAEEIDPRSGEHLGNFPQAFTHIGLLSAALALQQRKQRRGHDAGVQPTGERSRPGEPRRAVSS